MIIPRLATPTTTMLLLPFILVIFNPMVTGPFVVNTFDSEWDCDGQCSELVSPLHPWNH